MGRQFHRLPSGGQYVVFGLRPKWVDPQLRLLAFGLPFAFALRSMIIDISSE